MEKKTTKREYFAQVIAILEKAQGTEELIAFCEHEVELLNKKAENKKSKGASAENIALADTVYDVLVASGKGMTVSEVQKSNDDLAGLSTPKITALMRILMDNGRVIRTVDKKRTEFSAVVVAEETDEE